GKLGMGQREGFDLSVRGANEVFGVALRVAKGTRDRAMPVDGERLCAQTTGPRYIEFRQYAARVPHEGALGKACYLRISGDNTGRVDRGRVGSKAAALAGIRRIELGETP